MRTQEGEHGKKLVVICSKDLTLYLLTYLGILFAADTFHQSLTV
jgi:hypothetical protein